MIHQYYSPGVEDFEAFDGHFEQHSPIGYGLIHFEGPDGDPGLLYFTHPEDYEFFLKRFGRWVKKKKQNFGKSKFGRAIGDGRRFWSNTVTSPIRGTIGLVTGKTPRERYKTRVGKWVGKVDQKVTPIGTLVAGTLLTGGAAGIAKGATAAGGKISGGTLLTKIKGSKVLGGLKNSKSGLVRKIPDIVKQIDPKAFDPEILIKTPVEIKPARKPPRKPRRKQKPEPPKEEKDNKAMIIVVAVVGVVGLIIAISR
ncbi:MAG: hypothetical protein AAFQ94_09205 [Bacteroidota bacterium]